MIACGGNSAFALGLGEITVQSRLNEQFRAEIALLSVTRQDMESIRAGLAASEEFERVGIPRPHFLNSLRFRLVPEGGNPAKAIEITSKGSVQEPILNFLVEVATRNTRVVREYAVLLDPANYPVQVLPTAGGVRIRKPLEPTLERRYGPVKPGESLSELGFGLRPDADVAGAQMAWALYEANPHAFADGDINRLRVGAYLRIPAREAAAQVAYGEALRRLRGQAPAGPIRKQDGAGARIAQGAPTVAAPAKAALASGPKAAAASMPLQKPAPEMPAPMAVRRYGPVEPGESLSMLGFRLRPDSEVAGAQMAVALYVTNPQAFLDADINRLKVGAYLRVPSKEFVMRIPYERALLHLHGGAETPPLTESDEPPKKSARRETPLGSGAPGQTDRRAVPEEAAVQEQYELRILTAEEEARSAGASPRPALSQDEPAESQPDGAVHALRQALEARDMQVESLSIRLEELERRFTELQDVTAMGPQEASQRTLGSSPSEDASGSARLVVMEQTVAELEERLSRRNAQLRKLEAALFERSSAEDEESMGIGTTARLLLEGLLFLGTAGLLGWTLSLRTRWARERSGSHLEVDRATLEASTVSPEDAIGVEPGAAGADAGREAGGREPAGATPQNGEAAAISKDEEAEEAAPRDPRLSEAELYLAYGQLEQAERLLWDLVETHPKEADYRARLLRVLHSAGKRPPFLVHARELKRLLGDDESEVWEQVAELGRELCPGERLFSVGGSEEAEPSAEEKAEMEKTIMAGGRALYPGTEEEPATAPNNEPATSSLSTEDLDFIIHDDGDVAGDRQAGAKAPLKDMGGVASEHAAHGEDMLDIFQPQPGRRDGEPGSVAMSQPSAPQEETGNSMLEFEGGSPATHDLGELEPGPDAPRGRSPVDGRALDGYDESPAAQAGQSSDALEKELLEWEDSLLQSGGAKEAETDSGSPIENKDPIGPETADSADARYAPPGQAEPPEREELELLDFDLEPEYGEAPATEDPDIDAGEKGNDEFRAPKGEST